MTEFFFLQLLDREGTPVAFGKDDPERDQLLADPGVAEIWEPIELEVHEGLPTDYLANNLGLRLCSTRLKKVIEQHRGKDDHVQWLDAQVIDASGTKHPFFVLHLLRLPDVLDARRTISARGGFVVKPVLSREKAAGHHVFSFEGATTRLVISAAVRQAILEAGCTGVDFEKVSAA